MSGRPISSGSVMAPDGTIRAYLHIDRLRRIASKLDGNDAEFLRIAADVIAVLSERNRVMGRKLGGKTRRRSIDDKGASFTVADAAEGICELAADGPVLAYIGRTKGRVRVTRSEKIPSGAVRIGRFDIGADYREVDRLVRAVAA